MQKCQLRRVEERISQVLPLRTVMHLLSKVQAPRTVAWSIAATSQTDHAQPRSADAWYPWKRRTKKRFRVFVRHARGGVRKSSRCNIEIVWN